MKKFLVILSILFCTPATGWAKHKSRGHHPHHSSTSHIVKRSIAVRRAPPAELAMTSEMGCASAMLYREARGVKSEAAKIEVARLVLSRVGKPGFSDSVCAVVKQKDYNPIKHKVVCQFQWVCARPARVKYDAEVITSVRAVVVKAMALNARFGPIDALYFTSSHTCPVPARSRYQKGPFTFCVPKHRRG